jgi:hypothetical protein
MADPIATLRTYRDRLKARGDIQKAEVVRRCIALLQETKPVKPVRIIQTVWRKV